MDMLIAAVFLLPLALAVWGMTIWFLVMLYLTIKER